MKVVATGMSWPVSGPQPREGRLEWLRKTPGWTVMTSPSRALMPAMRSSMFPANSTDTGRVQVAGHRAAVQGRRVVIAQVDGVGLAHAVIGGHRAVRDEVRPPRPPGRDR